MNSLREARQRIEELEEALVAIQLSLATSLSWIQTTNLNEFPDEHWRGKLPACARFKAEN